MCDFVQGDLLKEPLGEGARDWNFSFDFFTATSIAADQNHLSKWRQHGCCADAFLRSCPHLPFMRCFGELALKAVIARVRAWKTYSTCGSATMKKRQIGDGRVPVHVPATWQASAPEAAAVKAQLWAPELCEEESPNAQVSTNHTVFVKLALPLLKHRKLNEITQEACIISLENQPHPTPTHPIHYPSPATAALSDMVYIKVTEKNEAEVSGIIWMKLKMHTNSDVGIYFLG